MHEKILTPNIISIELILYLKTSDCQFEVKESKIMYPIKQNRPAKVVVLPSADSSWFERRKMDVPRPSWAAVAQSKRGYLLPETTLPINMTGMTLQAFARTWVGNETNLSASYWNQEERMFDREQKEYL